MVLLGSKSQRHRPFSIHRTYREVSIKLRVPAGSCLGREAISGSRGGLRLDCPGGSRASGTVTTCCPVRGEAGHGLASLKRPCGSTGRPLPDTLIGKRDRALLLLGFAAALRRSELVGLVVADLERTESGLIVHIRRSKTDQEQEGQQVRCAPASSPARSSPAPTS